MSTDLTEKLRAEFDARAETLVVGTAPLDAIGHRIGAARRRRRGFGTLAGALALIGVTCEPTGDAGSLSSALGMSGDGTATHW